MSRARPVEVRMTLVRRPLVALALASALSVACVESRLDRALKTPDQIQALDHRSPYLKVHMKDGRLFLLSKWLVDDALRQVAGPGELFGLARAAMGSGAFPRPR